MQLRDEEREEKKNVLNQEQNWPKANKFSVEEKCRWMLLFCCCYCWFIFCPVVGFMPKNCVWSAHWHQNQSCRVKNVWFACKRENMQVLLVAKETEFIDAIFFFCLGASFLVLLRLRDSDGQMPLLQYLLLSTQLNSLTATTHSHTSQKFKKKTERINKNLWCAHQNQEYCR